MPGVEDSYGWDDDGCHSEEAGDFFFGGLLYGVGQDRLHYGAERGGIFFLKEKFGQVPVQKGGNADHSYEEEDAFIAGIAIDQQVLPLVQDPDG